MSAFSIEVPPSALEHLAARLAGRRRFRDGFAEQWDLGVPRGFIDRLIEYWLDGYDWRAQQCTLNSLPQFRVAIDDVPIHFFHRRGVGPSAIPIVLTHGWPWSFFDYLPLLEPLTDPAGHGGDPADAFDVVIPSLPGFGFSTPVVRNGLNFWSTAPLWRALMKDVLGYSRFAAHGCDMGAMLTAELAHRYADDLIGVHLVGALPPMAFNVARPWGDVTGALSRGVTGSARSAAVELERRFAAHVGVQCLSPLTLAHALHDSPVGLAAWLIEPRQRWSDCNSDIERVFTFDHLINTVMAYWLPGALPSALSFYANAWRRPWRPAHDRRPMMEAPTGISWFRWEQGPARQAARLFNVVYEASHDRGGHFTPVERPDALIDDIRATFRPFRHQN